jgi:hypothetical protein
MKTLLIECGTCGAEVEKPKKEIVRQKKKGRTEFFCSRSCSGKASKVFDDWRDSKENLIHLKSISNNRKDEYSDFREYYRRAQKRIKRNGTRHPFDLDLPYLKKVFDEQGGRCKYTNVQLEHPTWTGSSKRYNFMGSLDRIDNSKGYIKGNIQFVSVSVNWLKNQMDDEHLTEFFQIVSGGDRVRL